MSDLESPVPELNLAPNVRPTTLAIEVHAVHYADDNTLGAFIQVHGDNDHIVSTDDGSINLFLSPQSFRNLLKTLVEVLVFEPVEEVNEQGEEGQAEAAAQGSDDSEGV